MHYWVTREETGVKITVNNLTRSMSLATIGGRCRINEGPLTRYDLAEIKIAKDLSKEQKDELAAMVTAAYKKAFEPLPDTSVADAAEDALGAKIDYVNRMFAQQG
jgi:phenylpyruvate tautomerase PptA (4-oxalocrotonate tautomerase family)